MLRSRHDHSQLNLKVRVFLTLPRSDAPVYLRSCRPPSVYQPWLVSLLNSNDISATAVRWSLTLFNRALVLFNPAAGAAVSGANTSVLRVANAAVFANWPLNSLQRAILALPGQDVPYVTGRITQAQVASNRPSYINGILIQRAGAVHPQGNCLNCQRRGLSPFTKCRRTQGHFGGCCGNCKWREHASQCPWPRDQSPSPPPSNDSGDSNDSFRTADDGEQADDVAKRRAAIPPGRGLAVVILT